MSGQCAKAFRQQPSCLKRPFMDFEHSLVALFTKDGKIQYSFVRNFCGEARSVILLHRSLVSGFV